MKIEKKQIDELDIQLTLSISKDDYAEAEKKKLKERRKNADIKGFRKGMAPMSLIQKFYGEQALLESVNEVISEALSNYIKDNKLRIVGEPLSSEDQPELDWKSGNDLVFKFDIATTPEVKVEVSEDDKVTYYNINVTEQAKKEMKENMLKQLGALQDAKAAKEDDFVIADLKQGEKILEKTYIAIRNVEGEAKDSFIGCKVGDSFDVNVNEAFKDDTDRASMLKISKDELANIEPVYNVTIVEVKTFVPAKENQEAYDKLFGKDTVKTPDEFDAAVAERLELNYTEEADFRLAKDIKAYFLDKYKIQLPEEFLKRWLFHINEGKFTMEEIEKDFAAFLEDFRWQMIRSSLMDNYKIKVEQDDLVAAAENLARYQYAMYGMNNVPEQMLKDFAQRLLSDERQARQIYEQVEDKMVIDAVRKEIKLQNKKISVEKFRELK